jgi:hypothetical protein
MGPHASRLAASLLLIVLAAAPEASAKKPAPEPVAPDLQVTQALFTGSLDDGSTGHLAFTVLNQGDPTPVDVILHFQLDDSWLGNTVLPAGFQGSLLVESPEAWTAVGGSHTFWGTADVGRQLAEPHEDDNEVMWSFFVAGGFPTPTRETFFQWWSGFNGETPPTVETRTVFLAWQYDRVLFEFYCLGATLHVYIDGQLAASCVQGTQVVSHPGSVGGDEHTFTIVYAGLGSASVDISGIPMMF